MRSDDAPKFASIGQRPVKDRFARTDNVLDRPQRLVNVSHRFGIVDGVSP